MAPSSTEILRFLKNHARRPLTAKEILTGIRLPKSRMRAGQRLLTQMVEEGALVHLKGDRYSLPRQVNLIVGTVSVHREGYGFVTPSEGSKDAQDVFIPARFMGEVMDGDSVVVRIERMGRRGSPEGRILRIQQRAHRTLIGRYEEGRRFGYVVPSDPRINQDLIIPLEGAAGARPGQIVIARIDAYPGRNRSAEGVVVEVLGDAQDPQVEIRSIAHAFHLPCRFSEEVLSEAAQVPQSVQESDLVGREDLRHLQTVTIDGETAKDFDDAVAVQREGEDKIRLWVSIADVSHYVAEGSALDREAFERGTSVYFPGQCIPMLPEDLSNGICSLNPGVDRLTVTAEMVFDRKGHRLESRFYPSVIRSHARLTYTEVRDIVEEEVQEVVERYAALVDDLALMKELALRLMGMRRKRGSLDFDLVEAEIVLGLQGAPEDIVRAERTLAHRMIEEFMLAANEAVASFLDERNVPQLFRVHEPPLLEKLQAFQQFIAYFNYGFSIDGEAVAPQVLQQLLAEVEGHPEERMINQVLLRSMKQACYSSENTGHFGLAADLYCHFTSPIRRYPDLVVHRILKETLHEGRLSEKRCASLENRLPAIADHTSTTERRAMEAERDIVNLKKCQYMASRVSEVFSGIVSSVTPFGVFVELEEVFVEGLVHISSLTDDFYQYEEELHRLIGQNRRQVFQVGKQVEVRVENVNLQRREIDFTLTDMVSAGGRRSAGRPH